MKTFALALLVACAPTAMTTNAQHPANPDAPTGRLAGPPAALRPGVADMSKPVEKPRKQITPPASKKAPAGTSTDTKQPPLPAHQGHEGHH